MIEQIRSKWLSLPCNIIYKLDSANAKYRLTSDNDNRQSGQNIFGVKNISITLNYFVAMYCRAGELHHPRQQSMVQSVSRVSVVHQLCSVVTGQ